MNFWVIDPSGDLPCDLKGHHNQRFPLTPPEFAECRTLHRCAEVMQTICADLRNSCDVEADRVSAAFRSASLPWGKASQVVARAAAIGAAASRASEGWGEMEWRVRVGTSASWLTSVSG